MKKIDKMSPSRMAQWVTVSAFGCGIESWWIPIILLLLMLSLLKHEISQLGGGGEEECFTFGKEETKIMKQIVKSI